MTMRVKMQIYAGALLLFNAHFSEAQRVFYSPIVEDRSMARFGVAGKAGDYYWVQEEKWKKNVKHQADSWANKVQIFEIYDSRMNLVKTVLPPELTDAALKEYFVAGNRYFDQLLLVAGEKKTVLSLERYTAAGQLVSNRGLVDSFPFNEPGNNFLLVRSEDKNRILLLGFESVLSSSPKLHAILFDQDWNRLYYKIYQDPNITQPLIQDDFFNFPIEHFDNGPVKLANNGQWLMSSPSRTNHNFLLFHFCGTEPDFSFKEIRLPPSSLMEDVAVSVNNEKGEAFAGILSRFRYSALKNVQVIHYSMAQQGFDFDSSYRFNTLTGVKVRNENLTKESFIAVPDAGFMLLKEYGRKSYESFEEGSDNLWDPAFFFAGNSLPNNGSSFSLNRDAYTRYNSLGGMRNIYERGDLSLFYLPARPKDSCWSGIINKEQTTELNSPYLSYLVVPVRDKLFFIYNSFLKREDQFGTTTIIDQQGKLQPDASVIFWKFNNILNFQQSRQISENEVAIPYENYRRNGFAIIQFN